MVSIVIDKETQKELQDCQKQINNLNQVMQSMIVAYIRAKGHSTDIKYNLKDDFSLITEQSEPEEVAEEVKA